MGQHILVPVDGSPHSEKALEYVLEELPEPTITLLHVINPVSVLAYSDKDGRFDVDAYQQIERRKKQRAEKIFDEYREKAAVHGIEIETSIKTGKPAERILETAENGGFDHIVIGSRGRSTVGQVLFGSVARTVTNRAAIPVTVVR